MDERDIPMSSAQAAQSSRLARDPESYLEPFLLGQSLPTQNPIRSFQFDSGPVSSLDSMFSSQSDFGTDISFPNRPLWTRFWDRMISFWTIIP